LKPAPRKAAPPAATVQIERVGVEGDGVGRLPDGTPVYLPLTLPGEAVLAEPLRSRGDGWLARAAAIEAPAPERVSPPCPVFGQCGGCVLQHWDDAGYRSWKRGLLDMALRRAGFAPLPDIGFLPGLPGERRRMDFAIRRDRGRTVIGLHAAGSADVVDLPHCLVLHPRLMALMDPLRQLLGGLDAIRREASLVVNLLDAGPDILLRTDADPSLTDRTSLTAYAQKNNVPRVSWARGNGQPETICLFRPAATGLSGVEVRPPPGAFLQATQEGEAAIIAAVLAGLPAKLTARARVAELYAGCGTLSFALAGRARVSAFEGDAAAIGALKEAANRAGLTGRVEASQRDLARQPLSAKDLSAFAAVVLDPPHTGAAAQVGQIAASIVPVVIYVGCNPATLSRDAAMLRQGGYALVAATAIDQFLWSARLESVCVFQRR
jgi:23S rRNA (uracil1939-C5)-methyltransferase